MADQSNEKISQTAAADSQQQISSNEEVKPPSSEQQQKASSDLAILQNVLSYLKYLGVALGIYIIGWLHLSYVWILFGLFIYVLWRLNQLDKARKKSTLKQVFEDEIMAVSLRMEDLPSWVFFPDVERAEWLNKMLSQLWPFINDMVIGILKDTVEPKIKESVPAFLNSIHFSEISLGNQSPRIGGIKAYTQNVKRNEIILDIDLIYCGDADIQVSIKSVTVGISDFQMRGSLRVIMSPLIPQSPLVGGISVFFLDRPDIDFDLTNLLNFFDIPGLSGILRGCVDDVVASICVLPNRIVVPLAEVSPYDLKFPLPDGVLRIHVIEAKELVKKDIGVFKKGASDPYAIIQVGASNFRTETKSETLEPRWNEVFEAFVDHQHGQKIKIHLFDEDKTSDDESLGRLEVDINTVVQQGTTDLWLPLENTSSGQVHLRCTWFTLSSSPDQLEPAEDAVLGETMLGTAALFVKLDSASNLPVSSAARGTVSAFAKLTLGNVTYTSQTIPESVSPVWEEPFRFLVHDPKFQELDIEIFDSIKEKSIGKVDFSISRLLSDEDMTFEQPFRLKDSGHDSSLNCKFILRTLLTRDDDTSDEEEDEPEDKEEDTKAEAKPAESETSLRKRNVTKKRTVSGDIQLTIRYNTQKSVVEVLVHKARDLIPCDSDNLADPYVRAYLLPEKSKRRTDIKKNTLNPEWEETFEWKVPPKDLKSRTLDIIVKNDVSFFSSSRSSMGQALIELSSLDLDKPKTEWYTLYDEKDD